MSKHSLNRKNMKVSKKPAFTLKTVKCVNVHCVNYDKLSETNCLFEIKKAMNCIYNIESNYQRKELNYYVCFECFPPCNFTAKTKEELYKRCICKEPYFKESSKKEYENIEQANFY